MTNTNVMVDLETMGVRPGSVILSIGAYVFTGPLMGLSFYEVIDYQSCLDAGLTTDPSTVEWWDKQSSDARLVIDEAKSGKAQSVGIVLHRFYRWMRFNGFEPIDRKLVNVWGNGASFDNALIHEAARRCGFVNMWNPYNDRCYRTLKNLRPDVKMTRTGIHHNALDDAKSQANHALAIAEKMGITL